MTIQAQARPRNPPLATANTPNGWSAGNSIQQELAVLDQYSPEELEVLMAAGTLDLVQYEQQEELSSGDMQQLESVVSAAKRAMGRGQAPESVSSTIIQQKQTGAHPPVVTSPPRQQRSLRNRQVPASTPAITYSAPTRIDLSIVLLVMGACSTLVSLVSIYLLSSQSANSQLLAMAEANRELARSTLNANAAIADRAVTEAGSDVRVSLIDFGGDSRSQENNQNASNSGSNPPAIAPSNHVVTISNPNGVELRAEGSAALLGIIPTGQQVEILVDNTDVKKVYWKTGNLTGFVKTVDLY